ncbi:MAG TPA: globin [Lacipirellulaceae bacterium]|nr:globin [Lacipirellulaceae bacterium]
MNTQFSEALGYQQALASYHRCEAAGGLFDGFYEIFFAKSPEIPPMFAKTDMERQKQDVMASVLMALRLASGDSVARQYIQKIAETHSRDGHGIRPELYGLWLDALCEAVARCDPQYTTDLENNWRLAMRPAINLMIASY